MNLELYLARGVRHSSLPGVLRVCLGSVFVSVDTVRSGRRRSMFLREGRCDCSFFIPCGRASLKYQTRYIAGMNGLLTFVLGHRELAPNLTRDHMYWREEG